MITFYTQPGTCQVILLLELLPELIVIFFQTTFVGYILQELPACLRATVTKNSLFSPRRIHGNIPSILPRVELL